jgi:hypothetical protein
MNRSIRWIGPTLAALAFAGPAPAENQENKADFSNTVTVREVHPEKAQIVVDDEGRLTPIFADGATKLLEGSRTIRLEEIEPGERVAVDADYEKATGGGPLIADRIVVLTESGEER